MPLFSRSNSLFEYRMSKNYLQVKAELYLFFILVIPGSLFNRFKLTGKPPCFVITFV